MSLIRKVYEQPSRAVVVETYPGTNARMSFGITPLYNKEVRHHWDVMESPTP